MSPSDYLLLLTLTKSCDLTQPILDVSEHANLSDMGHILS